MSERLISRVDVTTKRGSTFEGDETSQESDSPGIIGWYDQGGFRSRLLKLAVYLAGAALATYFFYL